MAAWVSSTFGVAKTTTLGAATVDTFTFSPHGQFSGFEVVHHGNVTNPIYVLVDDAIGAPTSAGDGFEVVLPGERVRFAKVGNGPLSTQQQTVVSVICAGAATVSVIGLR